MNKLANVLVVCLVSVAIVSASRPLNLRDSAPVNDKFVEQITRLAENPLTFVENRLVVELGISQSEAADYKLQFLQWISLNFLVNASLPVPSHGPFVPSVQVDEFWHNFILYTRKYQAWCFANFGYFVHHVPEEATSDTAVAEHDNSWKMTVNLMNELYSVNWSNGAADDMTCNGGCTNSVKGGYCQSGNCKPGVCQATGGPTTTSVSTTTTTA